MEDVQVVLEVGGPTRSTMDALAAAAIGFRKDAIAPEGCGEAVDFGENEEVLVDAAHETEAAGQFGGHAMHDRMGGAVMVSVGDKNESGSETA